MLRNGNRVQIWLALIAGIFLLGTIFIFALYALAPDTSAVNRPILLTGFTVALFIALLCIIALLRWLLGPYRQLVGEAKRAPVAVRSGKSGDEAAFVLETFQSVVAKLQAQQRELETLTAQASRRADSAERFNERIVASVPSGLIAFDSTGHATALNLPAQRLLNLNGVAIGQPVRSLFRQAPPLVAMVEETLRSGKLYRREEIEATDGEGRMQKLGATIAPIDPSGESGARGALCLLTDITEVTQLREQVALKRNLESLGEMSAGLAHEFKNTIATLHGYAQLLQNLNLNESGKTAAASLLQEVRSLADMVTAFLNFARPQALEVEDVSLWGLITECQTEMQSTYQDASLQVIVEGDPAPEADKVRADERMLRQAILNLMRNAAEAMPETNDNRRLTIHVSEEKVGRSNWFRIDIQDNGAGISAPDMDRIFIPFFTTKAGGHGIGLALAHRVVTEHGGSLTARNAPEGGAIFSIRLPAAL
jgi:nitrogen fixation/metabolism regulation signal transduction histidine kinase